MVGKAFPQTNRDKSNSRAVAHHRFLIRGIDFDFSSRTHIMGILNVTPDSFSDGGRFLQSEKAIERGLQMASEGADIIDIGGESSRPGSDPVTEAEEIGRVVPVIKRLSHETSVPLSIDTYKATVAEAALDSGAQIINDISGMTFDPRMLGLARRYQATIVLMHIKGTPRTMQQNPQYGDVVIEVRDYLMEQSKRAHDHGIQQVIVDPGIGFGKNLQHNVDLIRGLKEFTTMGCPVLVGPSRKSFIGTLLDLPVEDRMEGTAAAVTACILNGANIIRVHDVKEMNRVAGVADALKGDVTLI